LFSQILILPNSQSFDANKPKIHYIPYAGPERYFTTRPSSLEH
jgi:hypothetical protein